jgi:hypothetical protein
MNIGFFVRHFTERGTEVAIFDYAKYNEEILNNTSYIICFTPEAQSRMRFPSDRSSYDKFRNRFTVIEIGSIEEMREVIEKWNLSFFYTLTGGGKDMYLFDQKRIWGNCKTIKHCVFETMNPEGDFYIGIYDFLNQKYKTNLPIIPHIVDRIVADTNLREELHIPNNAIVYGRYGGYHEFNISMAHEAIREYLQIDPTCYFLFMNTAKFYDHPRIIYLEKTTDLEAKAKFVNTCDAMIHAREMGETFSISIAEFSIQNKPVFTCPCGDLSHIRILGEKAFLYGSKEELLLQFRNFRKNEHAQKDWRAYTEFSPEKVMKLFENIFKTQSQKHCPVLE